MKNSHIRIVLVSPSHPGNIGASARAMKTMGLSRLYLVDPVKFPHPEATYRAAHADRIVKKAVVTKTLDEALQGCTFVFGASVRDREMSPPLMNVREASEKVINECQNSEVAIVFGRERTGLMDDEIRRCHYQIKIPTDEDCNSLNLGAAVQVVAYEIRMAFLNHDEQGKIEKPSKNLATSDELEEFYRYLEKTMIEIGFLNPQKPRMMLPRFRQIFNRTQLDKDDVDLLWGMLKKIEKRL